MSLNASYSSGFSVLPRLLQVVVRLHMKKIMFQICSINNLLFVLFTYENPQGQELRFVKQMEILYLIVPFNIMVNTQL